MRIETAAIKVSIQRLQCSACGAEANAACNCGKPYVPASVKAAEAVKANPEKSDRAIAKEIGVDHKTVAKARSATGEYSPVERTGLDGKTRKLQPRVVPERELEVFKAIAKGEMGDACLIAEQQLENDRSAMVIHAGTAMDHAQIVEKIYLENPCAVTDDAVEFIRKSASAWTELAVRVTKDDPVERVLPLLMAMNSEQRAQFFAKYTELSAAVINPARRN
jgi:hypothetical protein